jgi:hypothetical protein
MFGAPVKSGDTIIAISGKGYEMKADIEVVTRLCHGARREVERVSRSGCHSPRRCWASVIGGPNADANRACCNDNDTYDSKVSETSQARRACKPSGSRKEDQNA